MTVTELWQAARVTNPKIQLRDVWFILQQCESRGLVYCLNPQDVTGRVFWFTPSGCNALAHCGNQLPALPPEFP